jgi:hypothetical protein
VWLGESSARLDELLVSLVELPVSLDELPAGRGESLVRLGVLLAQAAVIGGVFLAPGTAQGASGFREA